MFYAYLGFDALTTAAQETKTAARDVPIRVIGPLLICMILYVLVSLVLTGVVNYKQLNVSAPVVFAIERVGPAVSWTKTFFELGAVAGLSSGVLVALLAQPRILYQMAQDGLLPRIFAQVHPRFRTPSLTTLVAGAVTAVMSALFPLKLVVALVSIDGKVTNADCVQAWSDGIPGGHAPAGPAVHSCGRRPTRDRTIGAGGRWLRRSKLFCLPDVTAGSGNDREQSFGLTRQVTSTLPFREGVHQIPWKPQIAWKMTFSIVGFQII
jgi:hypothetical protein